MGLIENEVEIEPGHVLELQAALAPARLAPNHDVRGHEAENLEVLGQLRRIPNLAVLRFEALPLGRWVIGFHRPVDQRQSAAADFFSFVVSGHNGRLCHRPASDRHWINLIIDNYREGWLPGRAMLLRLWFSSHPDELDRIRMDHLSASRLTKMRECDEIRLQLQETILQRMERSNCSSLALEPKDELEHFQDQDTDDELPDIEKYLRCLLDLSPQDIEVRLALAENLEYQGKTNDVLALAVSHTATAPGNPHDQSQWGDLFLKLGRLELARERFQAAIELDARYQGAWIGLGDVFSKLGDLESANRAYDKVIEIEWFNELASRAQEKRIVNAALVLFQGKCVVNIRSKQAKQDI